MTERFNKKGNVEAFDLLGNPMPRAFVHLATPVRGEHRFFRLASDKPPRFDIYVGDESGSNPDLCDDGPLRIDPSRPMVVGLGNGHCYTPVIMEWADERNDPNATVVLNLACAVWLLGQMKDLKVKFGDSPAQAELLQKLLDAPRWKKRETCEFCFNLGFHITTRKRVCLPPSPGNHEDEAIIVECDNCSHHPEAPWGARNHVEAAIKFWRFWSWACDAGLIDDVADEYHKAMAVVRGEVK